MISQYPHSLFVRQAGDSVQDADGNWSTPASSWLLYSICREQTNGKGTVINGADGRAIVYGSVVHMPVDTPPIADGVEVMVSESDSGVGVQRIEGRVLKFDRGQLHCRLWV